MAMQSKQTVDQQLERPPGKRPRSVRLATGLAVVTLAFSGLNAALAVAGSVTCVGSRPGCYATLHAAVQAAADGDTLRLLPGKYAGGVTITKSINLIGSGADRTVIRGGGPVLTIKAAASGKPVVRLSGLTVTGGVNRGAGDGVTAEGGGIFIPPAGDGVPGATVRLTKVRVTGNRTAPRATFSSPKGVQCPKGQTCLFAYSAGGGIASWGNLTLVDSVVSHNVVGGRASDAVGGGIRSALGTLTIESSAVNHNRVAPVAIGRFSEGGGIFVESGDLALRSSVVNANRAELVTRWVSRLDGSPVPTLANGGGVHVSGKGHVQVENSKINSNVIKADDPVGQPVAFDAALLLDGASLTMRHSEIKRNVVCVRGATSADVEFSGTIAEFDGDTSISHTVVTHNRVYAYSKNGEAKANGGLAFLNFYGATASLTRVRIEDNITVARSRGGSAHAFAGGIWNSSKLTVTHSRIRHNLVAAHAPEATARGGGIANQAFPDPPVQLALMNSRVTHNVATTSSGGTAQGGGIYTEFPVLTRNSRIAWNKPDQCFGCTSAPDQALHDRSAKRHNQLSERPSGRAGR